MTDLPSTSHVTQNRFALCVRDREGMARCRWRRSDGLLGNELSIVEVERVAIGNNHACIVTRGGHLACWGANEVAQVADPKEGAELLVPKAARMSEGVRDIAVGLRHTCAAQQDGSVTCFGDNRYGQLGNFVDKQPPGSMASPSLPRAVTAVAAGFDRTCALTDTGDVYCWGAVEASAQPPTKINDIGAKAKAIGAGGTHACALRIDGRVACWSWGVGPSGVMIAPHDRPTLVDGALETVELGVGDAHACARDTKGVVRCWGDNRAGQLGREVFGSPIVVSPPHSCPHLEFGRVSWVTRGDLVAW